MGMLSQPVECALSHAKVPCHGRVMAPDNLEGTAANPVGHAANSAGLRTEPGLLLFGQKLFTEVLAIVLSDTVPGIPLEERRR